MHSLLHKPVIILFFLASLISSVARSQDVDRKRLDIYYIKLPYQRLPEDVATYFVNIKPMNSNWGNSLGNIYDAETVKLNGYHRLPDATDADLVVESEVINSLVFEKATERTAELTYRKDKNSPTITYIAYYYTISYYTPKMHYRIVTKAGKVITDGFLGGVLQSFQYGSTDYSNYFSSGYPLASSWKNAKSAEMASRERDGFTSGLNYLAGTCLAYCMYPAKVDYSVRYVDERKGRSVYADLTEAKDLYVEAVQSMKNDKIVMVNKLITPDYETRKETMKKAIAIWEKALEQANFEDKKARIDSKVGRHLYYNLAQAYLWMNDFDKAREYAQGRKKDVGSWDKNFLSGIAELSALIDDRAKRQEANKWRTVLLTDPEVYVYKDPATRMQEKEAAAKLAMETQMQLKAHIADSIAAARGSKTKVASSKAKAPVKAASAAKTSVVKKSTIKE